MRTEYFKHSIYSPFFFSSKCSLIHNSIIFGSCIIHILYTGCGKIKKNNSSAKRLTYNFDVTTIFDITSKLQNISQIMQVYVYDVP